MKTLLRRIFLIVISLSIVCGDVALNAAPAPAKPKTSVQDKKKQEAQKAKEKKQKEAQKAKEQKSKEQAKKKAQQEKQKQKQVKQKQQQEEQRAKEQAARQRENERKQAEAAENAAKQEALREAQKQAYLQEQERLNDPTPRKEVVSLVNLSAKLGYSAMMDRQTTGIPAIGNPEKLDSNYPYQSLTGGAGAGFAATYELQYGAFRFETGLDFTFLNSTSHYGFMLNRTELTHSAVYSYITSDLQEMRNIGYIGLPVMFGAQFSRYFFMLGAKVGYGVFGNYKQNGQYDITVNDPALFEPYGLGTVDVPQEQSSPKLSFRQPSLSLCAEFGIDLDEWLQAQPDKKNKKRVKAGERLPFGKEHIHYKLSAFAEYGVLNTNLPTGNMPLAFADNTSYLPTGNNSVLNLEGTKLNNLFVGLKFAVQFEVPGKTPRPTPPPPSYAEITIVDETTGETLPNAMLRINSIDRNRTILQRTIKTGEHMQKVNPGNYQATAQFDGYYPATVDFSMLSVGDKLPVKISLKRRPVFNVKVVNADTYQPIQTAVALRKQGTDQLCYTLHTDSVTGEADMILADSLLYDLHIEQMGFEAYHAQVPALDSRMTVVLHPIKKGDVFVVHNLFFATNKTKILKTSEEALNELYHYLDTNEQIHIRIIGHTDNVGSDAANLKLSEGRANAVREDLIKRGIAPERILSEGRGESQPVDTNDTEEGRQNNRRVEIEIL